MIAVLRIAGQVKQKQTSLETLNRLKLGKKFTCTFVDQKDNVKMGMVESVRDEVAYGEISKELEKKLKDARGKENKEVLFLHPPRGGFKKSSKVRYPKGILGHNPDIAKLLERML